MDRELMLPDTRSIYHPQRSTSGSGVLGTSAIFNAAMKSKDICSMEGKLWQTYAAAAAAAAKSLQLCPTLCDPIDGSPPGSPVPGILQARTLEWVAISFFNAWKWKWSHAVVSDSSRPHGLQPTRFLRPWDFPGKSTGVGCHCLLLPISFYFKASGFHGLPFLTDDSRLWTCLLIQ